MKNLLMAGLLTLSTAAMADGIYLAEDLLEVTEGNLTAEHCITNMHVGLANRSVRYAGPYASSGYTCEINFAAKKPGSSDDQIVTGKRKIRYSARATQYESTNKNIQEAIMDNFTNSNWNYSPLGYLTNEVFGTIGNVFGFLGDLFEVDRSDDMIKLTPKFGDLYSSMDVACHVIALDLVDAMCMDTSADQQQIIERQIRALTDPERLELRRQLRPTVTN